MSNEPKEVVQISWRNKVLGFLGKALNGLLFYAGWLVCMQQATGEYPWVGPLFVLLILIGTLSASPTRWVDLLLIIVLGLVGTLIDTLYIKMGMIQYKGGYHSFPSIAPLWISSLYALYASSVNHSLVWLRIHTIVACVLGAFGAISSYVVGIELGAATFLWPHYLSLTVIGAVWAFILPASFRLSDALLGK